MAKVIVGIHGLANKPEAATLGKWWRQSIAEGLTKNSGLRNPSFDFKMVYYADVFYSRPVPAQKNDEPYVRAKASALRRYDEGFFDFIGDKVEEVIGLGLDEIKQQLGFTTKLIDRGLKKVLADLGRYYLKDEDRNSVRERLRKVLEEYHEQEILLVAHSMGSIVAYDVLRELGRETTPAVTVSRFATIGSPIGLAHVKRKMQLEWGRRLRTPSVVSKSWVNFADRRDYVALDSHLRDDYRPNSTGVRVHDDRVCNDYPDNPHKSYGYLRTPEFSEYVADFL